MQVYTLIHFIMFGLHKAAILVLFTMLHDYVLHLSIFYLAFITTSP